MNSRIVAPLWISAIFIGALSALMAALATQSLPQIITSWVFILAASGLVVWRWNKQFHGSITAFAAWLLAISATCNLAGAVLNAGLLSSLSFVFVVGSFLTSHFDEQGKRLTRLWAPFAMAICIPVSLWALLASFGQRAVLSQTENLLTFFSIPYFVLQPANTVFGRADFVALESVWNSWASWQFLAGCILLHQALLRRSGIVLILNLLLGIPLIVMLQTIAIVARLVASEWYAIDFVGTFAWTICIATSAILTLLAFVSAERFLLGLCLPIASSFGTGRANPIVFIWNRIFAARTRESEPKRKTKQSSLGTLVAPIAMIGIVVAGIVQATKLPSAAARFSQAEARNSESTSDALSAVFEQTPVFVQNFSNRLNAAIGPRSMWLLPHLVQPVTLTLFHESVNLEEAIQHAGFHSWDVVSKKSVSSESVEEDPSSVEIIELSSPQEHGSMVTLLMHVDPVGEELPYEESELVDQSKEAWSLQMTIHSMVPGEHTTRDQMVDLLRRASKASLAR